jgi:uncharacterized membrane-anchored protein YhcB (DUF1043 family)
MKKVKYFYNTHKLKFEKIETPLRVRLLQAFGFIAASIVTGLIIMSIVFRYVEKPNEKFLRKQNDDLKDNYALLEERTKQLELKMDELENQLMETIKEFRKLQDSVPDGLKTLTNGRMNTIATNLTNSHSTLKQLKFKVKEHKKSTYQQQVDERKTK